MWQKVVERKGQSVLISSYFYNGSQTKYFTKTLGFLRGLDQYLIINYSNYYKESEVNEFKRVLAQTITQHGFEILSNYLQTLYESGNDLIQYSQKLRQMTQNQLQENTIELFDTFSQKCLAFGPAMYLPILAEEQVENEIRRICTLTDNPNHYFELFTTACKETEGTCELENLQNIAKAMHDQVPAAKLEKMLIEHLREFGWISYTKFVGTPWSRSSIQERAQHLLQTHPITSLVTQYLQNKQETQAAIQKFNISNTDAHTIWLAKEITYFRTYRVDTYTKAGYNAKPLFEIAAQKIGITSNELVWLTYEEILTLLEKKKPADCAVIRQRREGDWQLRFDHGQMTFKYDQFDVSPSITKTTSVHGQPTYRGLVQGYVQIIRGVNEFHKMKSNAVLVTSMTTPDFVPLMQKASAIVTDEGGITCHAAIVSRELKIPCIVGTKEATRVFKDEDLVEVDAIKGIVKKIE